MKGYNNNNMQSGFFTNINNDRQLLKQNSDRVLMGGYLSGK